MKVRGIGSWASVHTPNTTFDPVYCIDVLVSDEVAADLKAQGLKVKKTDDGPVVKFKRKQFRADGTENKAPTVVDAHMEPMTDLIGNGSEVIVQFNIYEWKNTFGSGVSADLQGVQVVNLIKYRAADGEEFEDLSNEAPAKPKASVDYDDDIPDVL